MIAEEPIRLVHGNRASCDGGGGPLGHPKVFIPLDKPGEVFPCGVLEAMRGVSVDDGSSNSPLFYHAVPLSCRPLIWTHPAGNVTWNHSGQS